MTEINSSLHPVWGRLLAALAPPRLVTIIGGGGKTGLMYYLATGLRQQGLTAIAATTAKIYAPEGEGHRTVLAASPAEGHRAVSELRRGREIVTLARSVFLPDSRKLSGLPPEWLDDLAASFADTYFIVEGDGAAGKAFKGHASYEPVVPAATSLLIPVIGADALGKPIEAAWVHRPELVASLAGVLPGIKLDPALITRVLLHPNGYLHNSPVGTRVVPFINKVESQRSADEARQLAETILQAGHPAVDGVVTGSLRHGEFTCYEAK